MADWIDKLTPAEAKQMWESPIGIEDTGRDAYGRRVIRQTNPLTMRDMARLKAKAEQA